MRRRSSRRSSTSRAAWRNKYTPRTRRCSRKMAAIFRTEPLTRAVESIVRAGGSDEREARMVAANLVAANLLGHDSHGIGMIPRYVDALLEGGLRANQHPKVQVDAGALLALDGCQGYGQVIGHEAMEMAIA